MTSPILYVLAGVYGLAVGSFVNVVIVRVPSEESIFRPRSKCPMCQSPIALRDNVPVVSWLLLRGKCRNCGEPIPAGYPLVELANGILWVLAVVRFDFTFEALCFAVLFSVLLALSVIDLELYVLPNAITYPSILGSLVLIPLLAWAVSDQVRTDIVGAVIGGLGYFFAMAAILIIFELIVRKEGMGLGDVKLALLLGLWLGYVDPYLVLYAFLISGILGFVVGAGVLLVRRENKPFPYGPWMAIGTIITILFSQTILDRLVYAT